MDHLIQIPQVGRAWEPIPEPWVTLGLLAGLPTSLQLGTLVSPLSLHSPGRLAKAAATLDALSGGRAFCGVGAGWWEREHLAFGLPFPDGDERIAALRNAIPGHARAVGAGHEGRGRPARDDVVSATGRPVCRCSSVDAARACCGSPPSSVTGATCPRPPTHVARAAAAMNGKRITVLDVPVLGRDRDEVAALVERLRGRVSAAAYARTHHAGVGGRPRRALPRARVTSGSTPCSSRCPICESRTTSRSSPT